MTREEAISALKTLRDVRLQGVEWTESLDMAIEALSRSGDLISRADAIETVKFLPPYREYWKGTIKALKALPSAEIAETEPIVIRSRTLMPTKDFKEWAKRVREINPNAVVIPCDAEVVSADRPHGEWKQTITWQPYCSNCEYVFGEDEEFSPFWKYCPMCGARMKGGAE